MKMSYETKQKMACQRKKRMRAYFNAYGIGSEIYLKDTFSERNPEVYYVLAYHELDDDFYYVLGDKGNDIFIGKVVYSGYAGVIKVQEESKKYKENKEIFDAWIKSVLKRREYDIRRRYNVLGQLYKGKTVPERIVIYKAQKTDEAFFVLKKEFHGKYYFVVKLLNGKYSVVKVGWQSGSVRNIVLTDEEFESNKEVFEDWISEAKKNDE